MCGCVCVYTCVCMCTCVSWCTRVCLRPRIHPSHFPVRETQDHGVLWIQTLSQDRVLRQGRSVRVKGLERDKGPDTLPYYREKGRMIPNQKELKRQ